MKFAGILLLFASCVVADEFIIYGPYDGYPKYYEEAGKAKGVVVEITQRCLDDLQFEHEIRLLPWMRAYALAEKGNGGIIGLSKSAKRLALFDYSEAIFSEHIIVLVKKGREFDFQGIPDLKGKTVGITRGTSYGTEYDQGVADGTLTIQSFDHTLNGLLMLDLGRIDAVLMGASSNLSVLAAKDPRLKPEQFTALPVPFKSDSKYLGIAKTLNMASLLNGFDRCLNEGHASGRFDDILQRYQG